MTKSEFEKIIAATGKNIVCNQSTSGYYRLTCDGAAIHDDSACEDVNGSEEEAMDFFATYLLENEVPNDKKELRGGIWFLK